MTVKTPPPAPQSNPPVSVDQDKWYKKTADAIRNGTRRAVLATLEAGRAFMGMKPERGWEAIEAAGRDAVKNNSINWKAIEAAAKDRKKNDASANPVNSSENAGTPNAPAAPVQLENAEEIIKGIDAFEEVLRRNPEAQLATRNIATLLTLLRQDAQCNSDQQNSLLQRVGFNPDNLEQILQCVFREDIDKIHARASGDQPAGEMVMQSILGYEDPANVTINQIEAKEPKPQPFQEVVDRMSPFHQLAARKLDNLGNLADYLRRNNIPVTALDDSLRQDPNLDQILETQIRTIENEINTELNKDHDANDPKVVAELQQFVDNKEDEKEVLSKKLEAIKIYKTLGLNQPKKAIKFDDVAVQAKLEQLGLAKREVPPDYEWESVLNDTNTAFYLDMLEKLRREMARRPNPEIMAVMHQIDPDKSLWRDIMIEAHKPIEALIYENCFDDGTIDMKNPVPAEKIIQKVEEIALTLGNALAQKNHPLMRVLGFMAKNGEAVQPAALEATFAQDSNVIQTWEYYKSHPDALEAAYAADPSSKPSAEMVEGYLNVLKTYQGYKKEREKMQSNRLKEAMKAVRENADAKLALDSLALIQEDLRSGAISENDAKTALASLDRSGNFIELLKTQNDPLEKLILDHFLDKTDPQLKEKLMAKIKELNTVLQTL